VIAVLMTVSCQLGSRIGALCRARTCILQLLV